MNVIIEDALGVYSGIQIQNVSNRIEPEKDHIIVYGELVARHDLSVANNYEPEICLNVLDPHGKIIYNTQSTHTGVFWITRRTTFSLKIEELSEKCEWDKIAGIQLSLFWKK